MLCTRSPVLYGSEGTDLSRHFCGSLLSVFLTLKRDGFLNFAFGLFAASVSTLYPVALLTLLVLEAFFGGGRFFRIFYGDDRVVPNKVSFVGFFPPFSVSMLFSPCSCPMPGLPPRHLVPRREQPLVGCLVPRARLASRGEV